MKIRVEYKGKIADLARDLRKVLRQAKVDRVAEVIPFKEFQHYKECYEVLGALVRLRCKKVCQGGGGPPFCQVRKCCQQKGIDGCWECDEFETCEKLDFLKPVHGNAHIKNLKKINNLDNVWAFASRGVWLYGVTDEIFSSI
jgi:hypothetical protein